MREELGREGADRCGEGGEGALAGGREGGPGSGQEGGGVVGGRRAGGGGGRGEDLGMDTEKVLAI